MSTAISSTFFNVAHSDLMSVVNNYKKTRPSDETYSAFFGIDKFIEFARQIEMLKAQGVKSIRLYMFREKQNNHNVYSPDNSGQPQPYSQQLKWLYKDGGSRLSQVSFAIIPYLGDEDDLTNSNCNGDYIKSDGNTLLLRPGGETTGLCPPRCPQ